MKLIFATNNENKVKEIQSLLPSSITVVSLRQANINIDIPEPYDTLEENAFTKSNTIFLLNKENTTGEETVNCFSEDTGLFVDALNGEPGVKSARYAGAESNAEANMEKLLEKLGDNPHRTARFKTVISYINNGENHFFEGVCEGRILSHKRGDKGFGYDPLFVPNGAEKTFAEMNLDEKSKFSHRAIALHKFILHLTT